MKLVLTLLITFSLGNIFSQKCPKCPDLYEQKQYKEVISEVAKIAETAEMTDLVLLAKSYQNLGMKKDAIGAYSHILLNDEKNTDALVAVGALFIDMEEYDNALFATDKALQLEAGNKNALYNKAVVYYYKEDQKVFEEYMNKVLEKDPKNTDLLFVKAMKAIEKQDFKSADETFKKIESIDDKFPNLNFYDGYALFKLNLMEEAKTKLKKSIAQNDDQIIDAHYYLAQIYKSENNKIDACESYTNAINLGDITLTKEADDYCNTKKAKKFKLMDRGVRVYF